MYCQKYYYYDYADCIKNQLSTCTPWKGANRINDTFLRDRVCARL